MSGRNRCELCNGIVKGEKARHKQTRYCDPCAKAKKKENTLSSWEPEEKRQYMRRYMRAYRCAHPGLSSQYVRKHRQKKQQETAATSSSARDVRPPHASVDQDPPSFSSLIFFVPLLWAVSLSSETVDSGFEAIKTAISYLELLLIKVTGLVIVAAACWRHVIHFWRDKEK